MIELNNTSQTKIYTSSTANKDTLLFGFISQEMATKKQLNPICNTITTMATSLHPNVQLLFSKKKEKQQSKPIAKTPLPDTVKFQHCILVSRYKYPVDQLQSNKLDIP